MLKEAGLDYDTWLNTKACTIRMTKAYYNGSFLDTPVLRLAFSRAIRFEPIHEKTDTCPRRIHNARPGKEDSQPPEGKSPSKGRYAKGKVGRTPFHFDFSFYDCPLFYIKYVKEE